MRVLIIPILIIAAFLAATLFMATSAPEEKAPLEKGALSVFIQPISAGVADAGENRTAYALLEIHAENATRGSVKWLWLEGTPLAGPKLLNYPAAGKDYESFRQALEQELARYGKQPEPASIGGLESLSGTLIIIASGRMPSKLLENGTMDSLLERGNVIVYAGDGFDYSINEDGTLSQTNLTGYAWSKNAPDPQTAGGAEVRQEGEGFFAALPYKDAAKAASFILENAWRKPLGATVRNYSGDYSGKTLVFSSTTATQENGFGRIIYEFQSEKGAIAGAYDSVYLERLSGSLQGPSSVFPNGTASYTATLKENYKTPTQLTLSLQADAGDGKKAAQAFGSANVLDVGVVQGSFTQTLEPGDYLLKAVDGEGNAHAQAWLHVKKLEVTLAGVDDYNYKFAALLDGQPIEGESAVVKLDNGKSNKTVGISNGTFIVPASVPQGKHEFSVLLMGKSLAVPYENTKEPMGVFYVKYGVPALIVCALLYLFLKKPDKTKLKLIVPELPPDTAKEERIIAAKFLRVFDLVEKDYGWKRVPLTAAEVRSGLRRHYGITATDSNVTEVLDELAKRGLAACSGEYYTPKEWLVKSTAEELALKRHVRETLIASGRSFKEEKDCIKANGGENTFFHFGKTGAGQALENTKKGRSVIVFQNDDELADFRKTLLNCNEESVRLSLESERGGITLTTAGGVGEAL